MVPETEAVGEVRAIYEEIKQQFGIDFVPTLYRVMATNSPYLAASWNRVKAIMFAAGRLDRLSKEIIAVAVSVVQVRVQVLARCSHFCGAEAWAG